MAALKTHSLRRSRHSGENETSVSISLIDALEEKASDAAVQALLDAHPEAAHQVTVTAGYLFTLRRRFRRRVSWCRRC